MGGEELTCGMQVRACEPEVVPAHSLTKDSKFLSKTKNKSKHIMEL